MSKGLSSVADQRLRCFEPFDDAGQDESGSVGGGEFVVSPPPWPRWVGSVVHHLRSVAGNGPTNAMTEIR